MHRPQVAGYKNSRCDSFKGVTLECFIGGPGPDSPVVSQVEPHRVMHAGMTDFGVLIQVRRRPAANRPADTEILYPRAANARTKLTPQ
jgi:hypothetical protein